MGHPTDIFLIPPASTFVCSICYDVLKDASSFKECGHTFCDLCLDGCVAAAACCPTCRTLVQTGSIPNYLLRDVIDSLEVRCPEWESNGSGDGKKRKRDNAASGCGWKGTVSDLHQHRNACGFKIIECGEQGCKHTCQRKDMEYHRSSRNGKLEHMELKYKRKLKAMEQRTEQRMEKLERRLDHRYGRKLRAMEQKYEQIVDEMEQLHEISMARMNKLESQIRSGS